MKRQDEMEEFAKGYTSLYVDDNYEAIKAGVEWADEHPRKGLVDIEKACEWLQDNTMSSLCLDLGNTQIVREFIDNFCNAMEE